MNDDIGDIIEFYNNSVVSEGARLERHQLEFDLTLRYLNRYLPATGTILEIGCATGRYTLELARGGYQVTAVDLSPALLEECQNNLAAAGLERQVRFQAADVRDLGEVTQRDFSAALLMGPLYHLIVEADRRQALRQVYKRLRPGGILFSAFISRYGILGDLMKNVPGWIEESEEVRSILDHGFDPAHYPRGSFRGYFAKASEIASLHESSGFETIAIAGVEPAISADDESYNSLEGEKRKLWLDLLDEISTEPSILGASRHLLYIGKKP